MLNTEQIIQKYGPPGPQHLVTILLPYRMRIAWDLGATVGKMQCHRLVAQPFTQVFEDLLAHYGKDELTRLDIDLYGGCYNFRKMRGGTSWSRHSWGIALDLSPQKNGLKTLWKNAQFAKPAYKPMIGIFYRHGFLNLGVEKGYDGMHFEIAS